MTRTMQFSLVLAAMVSMGAQAALRLTMTAETHTNKKSEKINIRSVVTTDKGKCRVDMSNPNLSTIALPSGESFTLFHGNRMLMRSKVDPNAAKKAAKQKSDLVYRKIQSNVSISGLVCDDYDVLSKNKKVMQMCIADLQANGLGDEMPPGSKRTFLQTVFKDKVSDMPVGLPARLISFADGKAVFTNLITKVERLGSVPASTFQVPAGYKTLELQLPNLENLFKF